MRNSKLITNVFFVQKGHGNMSPLTKNTTAANIFCKKIDFQRLVESMPRRGIKTVLLAQHLTKTLWVVLSFLTLKGSRKQTISATQANSHP